MELTTGEQLVTSLPWDQFTAVVIITLKKGLYLIIF